MQTHFILLSPVLLLLETTLYWWGLKKIDFFLLLISSFERKVFFERQYRCQFSLPGPLTCLLLSSQNFPNPFRQNFCNSSTRTLKKFPKVSPNYRESNVFYEIITFVVLELAFTFLFLTFVKKRAQGNAQEGHQTIDGFWKVSECVPSSGSVLVKRFLKPLIWVNNAGEKVF